MTSDDKRIILNVGGIKYETNRSTLTKYPNTFLGSILNNQQIDGNEIFYDRNAHAFRYILEYYRTGKILWTPDSNGVNLEEMITELNFFEIPHKLEELRRENKSILKDILKEVRQEDKEYNLDEVRELFKELSSKTCSSKTFSTLSTTDSQHIQHNQYLPAQLSTTSSQHNRYPPPVLSKSSITSSQYNPHRWATVEEHIQTFYSFINALSDVVYEIHRNLRGQVNILFYSRLSIGNSTSIVFDLDLDSIKEIMKPFSASGFKLLELHGNEIEKRLLKKFHEKIGIIRKPQNQLQLPNATLFTITINAEIRFDIP